MRGCGSIETVDAGDPHPNTYRLTLRNAQEQHSLIAISTGGGMIEVIAVDGFKVSHVRRLLRDARSGSTSSGDEAGRPIGRRVRRRRDPPAPSRAAGNCGGEGPAVRQRRRPSPTSGIASRFAGRNGSRRCCRCCRARACRCRSRPASEMLRHDAGRNTPLWQLAVEYEMARGDLTESRRSSPRWWRSSASCAARSQQGIAGTHYDDRVLGHQCGRFPTSCMDAGRLLDAGALNRIILYVTALMEVKSAMGVIVAAPTAGACAALPGAVIAMAEEMELVGGGRWPRPCSPPASIGVFIATRWTFAAEVGRMPGRGRFRREHGRRRAGDPGRRDARRRRWPPPRWPSRTCWD